MTKRPNMAKFCTFSLKEHPDIIRKLDKIAVERGLTRAGLIRNLFRQAVRNADDD